MNNKDAPYIWDEYGRALGSYWCRHDYNNHDYVHELFNNNIDLFQLAYEYENKTLGRVLFTHAGVTQGFKDLCGLTAESINNFFLKESTNNISNIVGLASVSWYRGGDQTYGSPIWADIREHKLHPVEEVFQVFGHTYSWKETITKNFAMLDTGGNCFLLDNEGHFNKL